MLACPRCQGSLEQADSLSCSRCGSHYPWLGALPCLVPDPSRWRAQAAQRLGEYLEFSAGRLAELELEQQAPRLLPRTRARLGRIANALNIERALIAKLMAPLHADAMALPAPVAFTEAPLAGTLDLLTCYEHVFRDWAWGEAESRDALRICQRLLTEASAERSPQRLAVFGAGAGRLAADLHHALRPGQTLALDLNPLPLLIADRLTRGESIEAYEFPVAPRGENEVAVARRLHCPFEVPAGLTFLVADALSAPIASASLDVVVTPWFIDAVAADPRVTAAAIGRVLKPGGLWLNFGPLRFTGPSSRLYTIDEILDIAAMSGFDVCAQLREQVPYFASPESGFQRLELVYGFSARKVAEAPKWVVPQTDPAWVVDPDMPVPALSLWTTVRESAALTDRVLSLVDGQRSIADIADTLAPAWGVPPRTLDSHLQAYLLRLLPR
jgi:SAM-dependent methyltransferase/uncharacterized protein YbaR (Trm112 family)